MRNAVLAGLAVIGCSGAAGAADISAQAPVYDWGGFYAGAQLGYTWSDAELVFLLDGDYAPLDPDGVSGGLYAGYNIATQSGFVFGVEADFVASGADSSGVDVYRASDGSAIGLYDFRTEINWAAAARLRAGYAFDRLLIYIAGGFAAAELNVTEDDLDMTDTYTGWTVGAGLDYALTDNLLVRAEYRYSDLGKAEYRGSDWSWFDVNVETHDARVGLAYKF